MLVINSANKNCTKRETMTSRPNRPQFCLHANKIETTIVDNRVMKFHFIQIITMNADTAAVMISRFFEFSIDDEFSSLKMKCVSFLLLFHS